MKKLRLGIYGGTFDPIHTGHLLLARDVLEQLKLDAIIFVPAGRSPFKDRRPHIENKHRLALLRLALKGHARFWLSHVELDRPPPSYSVDTARAIHDAFPLADLFWLIGGDQYAVLNQWHRPAELRRLVNFILLPRGGDAPKRLSSRVLSLPHPRRVDISATEIRQRVKAGLPIDHLVPAPVANYIRRHRLYL